LQEWAVKNKIAGKFARYAMLPRKGQSNFAVMLEVVNVGVDAQRLDLAADLDDYRRNIRFFAKSDNCPTLVQGSIYGFDRTFNQFIQGKCSHTALLIALSKLAPVRQPKSLRFDWIEPLQAESNCPEFRLALSIAYTGYLKPTISRLMGAKIYLKVPLSDRIPIGDIRAAAALAFPVSAKQVEAIIQKFFTQESDNLV
jgi:hypothetical protein